MATGSSNTKHAILRSIVNARRSANRFQVGRRIPDNVLKDVLEMTTVRTSNLVTAVRLRVTIGNAQQIFFGYFAAAIAF